MFYIVIRRSYIGVESVVTFEEELVAPSVGRNGWARLLIAVGINRHINRNFLMSIRNEVSAHVRFAGFLMAEHPCGEHPCDRSGSLDVRFRAAMQRSWARGKMASSLRKKTYPRWRGVRGFRDH